nr:hypothetical protein Iba_chr03bCG1820 [Ipomoea batatas]
MVENAGAKRNQSFTLMYFRNMARGMAAQLTVLFLVGCRTHKDVCHSPLHATETVLFDGNDGEFNSSEVAGEDLSDGADGVLTKGSENGWSKEESEFL